VGGYSFEDAILVSEKLIKEDVFTSIHIEEFELQVRDTKRGVEEITREIPNVSEEAVKNLDEEGIIRIGARVRQGDILVGKVTPKGEQELSPEERLLKAIFGDKAGDVRDASLKAPPGMDGIVIDIKVFSRGEKDEGTKQQEKKKIDRLRRESKKERERIADVRLGTISEILNEQLVNVLRSASSGEAIARKGRKYSLDFIQEIDLDDLAWGTPVTEDPKVNDRFWLAMDGAQSAFTRCEKELDKEIEKVTRGDELPPGVVKLVKVYIAKKRKLSVGDKMAGRHGNKGVVAKILAEEDLAYMPDGSPIEIVLNPLGVPSRMNIGQVMETHLGWAAQRLGYTCATPVFSGATVDEIKAELRAADGPEDGKTVLMMAARIAVRMSASAGYILHDEAVALGGRQDPRALDRPVLARHPAAVGRQGAVRRPALRRNGSVGARGLRRAHTLQELLTVKSDDVAGRHASTGDREGRESAGAGRASIVQRPREGTSESVPRGAVRGSLSALRAPSGRSWIWDRRCGREVRT
jgi:DNA-directed RNA polymerase subunit beta